MTKRIQTLPYNPAHWNDRAEALFDLGYAELAVGDAYKAFILIESAFDGNRSVFGKKVRTHFGRYFSYGKYANRETQLQPNFWNSELETTLAHIMESSLKTMVFSLRSMQDLEAADQLCTKVSTFSHLGDEGRKWIIEIKKELAILQETLNRTHSNGPEYLRREGHVEAKPYAFMPKEYLSRGKETITALENEFASSSNNCTITRGLVHKEYYHGSTGSDVYGICATADLATGDVLSIGNSMVAATSKCSSASTTGAAVCHHCTGFITEKATEKINAECCDVVYCSSLCQSLANSHHHKSTCGRDFSWLYADEATLARHITSSPLPGPLLLRVFALCLQNSSHPLTHPFIARLNCDYNHSARDRPRRWTYDANITQPIRILLHLGINPFTNLNYDTWVLQTIAHRLYTNTTVHLNDALPASISCGSLSQFFNHNCDPNVLALPDTKFSCAGTRVVYVAARDVRKGEELFVSYCETDWDRVKRQEALGKWWEGKCACWKCVGEEYGMWKKKKD